MGYYRIKIEELNNGEKHYTPQYSKIVTSGKWIKRAEIKWYNFSCGSFTTEEHATLFIQKIIDEENKNKVISTTYKHIN